jgi:hypothetical protein
VRDHLERVACRLGVEALLGRAEADEATQEIGDLAAVTPRPSCTGTRWPTRSRGSPATGAGDRRPCGPRSQVTSRRFSGRRRTWPPSRRPPWPGWRGAR